MSERIRAEHDGDTRRRPATALPVALLSAGAGFYLACFAYWLAVPVLFFTLLSGLIGLRLLGLISDSNQAGAALSVGLEWARASDAAPIIAGWLGVLLVLVQTIRTARRPAGWGRIQRSAAIVIGVAVIAAAVDVWYGVTPYVDRLLPPSDLATAQQSVTCRLTVSEVAALYYKQSVVSRKLKACWPIRIIASPCIRCALIVRPFGCSSFAPAGRSSGIRCAWPGLCITGRSNISSAGPCASSGECLPGKSKPTCIMLP